MITYTCTNFQKYRHERQPSNNLVNIPIFDLIIVNADIDDAHILRTIYRCKAKKKRKNFTFLKMVLQHLDLCSTALLNLNKKKPYSNVTNYSREHTSAVYLHHGSHQIRF